AAVQKLPAIFIIQNNQVALGTRLDQHHLPGNFDDWAASYGIPGAAFDGNNVLDAYAATNRAAERCRRGGGPALLVAQTFRMGGHATHDEREARDTFPRDLFEHWGRRDPIGMYEEHLKADGITVRQLEEIEGQGTALNRLLVLASVGVACRAPAAENPPSSPPGGQDTVVIAGHALYVPRGFTVNLFAEGLNGVRYLALGPGGAVYASLPSGGQIVRLVDANRDGVADAPAQVVLSGLNAPFGITFRGDTMYFAEQTTVKRLDPGATTPRTRVPSPPGGDAGPR